MTGAGGEGPRAVAGTVQHVRQRDPNSCTIACTAMVTGQTYDAVRAEWGDASKGHDWLKWTTYLVNRGYAVQHLWKHDSERKVDRPGWPLPPWTDVHLCAVDAGHGEGSHLVVLLRDGTVLDPATDEPRRWADCRGVLHMTGVVKVGSLASFEAAWGGAVRRAEELEMERDGARHMLQRLEWSIRVGNLQACPACGGKQSGQLGMRSFGGHTTDCSMATALGIPMRERIGHGAARSLTPGGAT